MTKKENTLASFRNVMVMYHSGITFTFGSMKMITEKFALYIEKLKYIKYQSKCLHFHLSPSKLR